MLEVRNIEQRYGGRRVLGVPFFRVGRGERLVLLGPNGSGKSTLLRLLSLVEMPTQGEVWHDGTRVDAGNSLAIRRRFALLLQKPVFFRGTVLSNVTYGLRLRGLPSEEIKGRLDKAAALFAIGALLSRRVDQLSGGEAQRVNLARAFIIQPEILFLDEPFSALDAPTREELLLELRRIVMETGQTTVLVTHHREEAAFFGTRLAVMLGGAICQEGAVEEVFSMPATDAVARLVGVETVLAGKVTTNDGELLAVSVGSQTFFVPGDGEPGEDVLVCVRPEDVFVSRYKPEGSVRNWFEGTISDLRPYGRTLGLTLECGFRLRALVTPSAFRELSLALGAQAWAGVKATSIHLIRRGGRSSITSQL
ncbi:MAG TPA: ABC transporter ATP-binding protein [Planctomycetota bacterium]|nr:ABC transporter ATP-binding protein [Planctomycetota bacterium]HRR79062.1 ABC transporter ATP-binding protein [Planctomycetota bacterium]HRT93012.1 ABC transporter ATP-binding protein [Planctomycetota bacterium]